MFQDFHFKIVHRVGAKHFNEYVLSRNLVGRYEADEDFGNEIQDLGGTSQEIPNLQETIINLFTIMEGDAGNYNEKVREKKNQFFTKMKDRGNNKLTRINQICSKIVGI